MLTDAFAARCASRSGSHPRKLVKGASTVVRVPARANCVSCRRAICRRRWKSRNAPRNPPASRPSNRTARSMRRRICHRAQDRSPRDRCPDLHPEGEMDTLSDGARFRQHPAAARGSRSCRAMTVQPHTHDRSRKKFVRNQGDGWTMDARTSSPALIEELSVQGEMTLADQDARHVGGNYGSPSRAPWARQAGASCTPILARCRPTNRNSHPEAAVTSVSDAQGWADSAIEADRHGSLRPILDKRDGVAGSTRPGGMAAELRAGEPEDAAGQDTARRLAAGRAAARCKTRIHGDFHLGQTAVCVQGDAYLIDFEGEPAQADGCQRRAKSCRVCATPRACSEASHYAVAAAAAERHRRRPASVGAQSARDTSMHAFRRRDAVSHFTPSLLRGKRALANAPEKWVDGDAEDHPLLDLFLMEKAAYEILLRGREPAELAAYIPLRGLHEIATRVLNVAKDEGGMNLTVVDDSGLHRGRPPSTENPHGGNPLGAARMPLP